MSDSVIAQVVFRSSGLDLDEPITAENVEANQAKAEDIEAAVEELRALGFEVVQTSEIGVTIEGAKELFEDVFDTTLEARSVSAEGGDTYEATDPVQIPEALSSLVEDVTFPVPPEFY